MNSYSNRDDVLSFMLAKGEEIRKRIDSAREIRGLRYAELHGEPYRSVQLMFQGPFPSTVFVYENSSIAYEMGADSDIKLSIICLANSKGEDDYAFRIFEEGTPKRMSLAKYKSLYGTPANFPGWKNGKNNRVVH